jgi:hypothetical protein
MGLWVTRERHSDLNGVQQGLGRVRRELRMRNTCTLAGLDNSSEPLTRVGDLVCAQVRADFEAHAAAGRWADVGARLCTFERRRWLCWLF